MSDQPPSVDQHGELLRAIDADSALAMVVRLRRHSAALSRRYLALLVEAEQIDARRREVAAQIEDWVRRVKPENQRHVNKTP